MTDVRILTDPLGGSPLSRAMQRGDAPGAWLAGAPRGADGWRRRMEERASGDWAVAWSRLEPALAAAGPAAARLARVRAAGGVVVTTGQQPGLFGGPAYTWSKAVGALAFADALEAATGIPTAALFWAATDDADFAEASATRLARIGGVELVRSPWAPPAGTPMALAPLGDLGAQLGALARACGSGADHRALDAVRASYADAAQTVGGAYVSLLRALLEPLGIPVLDASHEAVRDASSATIDLALREGAPIERALAARSAELRAAGFEPQVEDMPGMTLVFRREGAIKRRLALGDADAGATAGWHTPNVLLRPIVEHELLPTVGYWAGPGELAYFAQVSAVAAAMGTAAPLALPRWSCTLLEPHIHAALGRLGLQREDFATLHSAERRLARAAMSEETAAGLRAMRQGIARLPDLLGEEPRELGLDRSLEGTVRSLEHRVDRLERRILAGIARRDVDRTRDAATVRAALFPDGERQERALNLVPTLARHGLELLGEMRRAAAPHADALLHGAAGGVPSAPVG